MIQKGILLLTCLWVCLSANTQSFCKLTDYSRMADTPKGITCILQDGQGLLWMASTNGIYRYDGYEWRNFKSHSGDGLRLKTNNVRNIYLSEGGNIWCFIDNRAILFDLQKYRFVDVLAEYENHIGQQLTITKILTMGNGSTWFITDDANVLTIDNDYARQVYHVMKSANYNDTNIYDDEQGHTWITTPQATYTYVNHKLRKQNNINKRNDAALQKTLPPMPKDIDYQYEDAFNTTWLFSKMGQVYYIEKNDSLPHQYDGININPYNAYSKIRDNKGNLWLIHNQKLIRLSFGEQLYQSFPLGQVLSLSCGMKDRKGRLWLSDKDKGRVMLYTPDWHLLGYLASDGTLCTLQCLFKSPVYSMLQDHNGNIWLGTQDGELIRLRETTTGIFRVENFITLEKQKISDIKEDFQGRLWIATDKEGILCITHPNDDKPNFLHSGSGLNGFLPSFCHKTYTVLPTHDGHLLVGTAEGLYVADIRSNDVGNTLFKEHHREANRKQSISCSHVNSLTETANHRIFAITESGGINEIVTANLMADHLDFRHYGTSTGLPSDQSRNIFADKQGRLWIVYDDVLVNFIADDKVHLYNLYFRNQHLAFTDMKPLQLKEGLWLLGTEKGAVVADLKQLENKSLSFIPPIVLTKVNIDGLQIDNAPQQTDTILLHPGQRNVNLTFATLNYDYPQRVLYAFRMGDNKLWNNMTDGERSIFMANLEPGTYILEIRSTNGYGQWMPNEHKVVVIVSPTFWQTNKAKLLIAIIILLVTAVIGYTIYYILRIRRQRHETMDYYLALLNKKEETKQLIEPQPEQIMTASVSEEDEAFMKRLVVYIEENIGNSDASLKDMAAATATSRSSLHRKINRLTGMTPMDFLREARMRKACQLLKENNMAIVDIAYACGYSDPKYFSKSFKKDTGRTPSQYRNDN